MAVATEVSRIGGARVTWFASWKVLTTVNRAGAGILSQVTVISADAMHLRDVSSLGVR